MFIKLTLFLLASHFTLPFAYNDAFFKLISPKFYVINIAPHLIFIFSISKTPINIHVYVFLELIKSPKILS